MAEYKYVVNRSEFQGYAITYLMDGVCPYNGKTEETYIAEGLDVLTADELSELVENWEKSLCNQWKEISEDDFMEALNVLPPMLWFDGGFFMSERYYGDTAGFYQKMGGKFYTSLQHISTSRAEILENLRKWISENNS